MAAPTRPKPAIIIAQVAGSGMTGITGPPVSDAMMYTWSITTSFDGLKFVLNTKLTE